MTSRLVGAANDVAFLSHSVSGNEGLARCWPGRVKLQLLKPSGRPRPNLHPPVTVQGLVGPPLESS